MAKSYKVEDVTERTTITKRGLIQKMYRVTATTSSGTVFTVEIDEPNFNDEKVAEILTEKADLIERVRKL